MKEEWIIAQDWYNLYLFESKWTLHTKKSWLYWDKEAWDLLE